MIDTLRNSVRDLGAAVMNSEMVYSFLMGMGWFFLLGWAIALVVACASVFRQDAKMQFAGLPGKIRGSKPLLKQVPRG
jgi:hypothetical protein